LTLPWAGVKIGLISSRPASKQLIHEEEGGKTMADMEKSEFSRRKALKLIASTVGAVTLASLPGRWSKPNLKVGVLPVHAQISQAPYAFSGCSVTNVQGGNVFAYFDTISTTATISPAAAGIQLRRTISLNEAGHPQNGVVDVTTAATDAAGSVTPAFFDLFTISPPISPGVNRISVLWEFVNPAEGVTTCQTDIDIADIPGG